MIRQHLPALQVVVPLVAALLAALVRRPRAAFVVALIAALAMPVMSGLLFADVLASGPVSYRLGGWATDLGIEYRVDLLNGLILILVSLSAAVLMPFAARSAAAEIGEDRLAWFYAILLLCIAGLAGMAITGDAFNAFVFMEISSLATYTLVALGRDRRALVSAFQYLIVGTVGATFYVIGVGFLYVLTGTLNLALIAERLVGLGNHQAAMLALAFIVVGLALKLALFPLHAWLPNAYAYAPSAATVFLAATATKVALYLLVRYVFGVFGGAAAFAGVPGDLVLIALSVAAIFVPSAVAVWQDDVKRLLAFSSVGQVGYITLGIALMSVTGLTAGLVHMLNHALVKAALFMAVGAVTYRIGPVKMEDWAGIGRRMPLTIGAFTIAGLGLVGVPGTVGFVSKWYLVVAAFERGWWWLAFLVVASSLITVVYMGRLLEVAWFRAASPRAAVAREAPPEMLAMLWLLAGASVWFGLDAEFTAGMAQKAAVFIMGEFR